MEKDDTETTGAISFKAMATKSLKFENGELSIWGVKGSIFSNHMLAYLAGVIAKKKMKDTADAMYWAGYTQAVGATLMTTQRFGFKEKVFDNVFSQSRILGYGIVYIKEASLKDCKGLFHLKTPIAKEYLSDFGKADMPICHHMRGLFAGVFGVLAKKDVVCIEEKCVAMGDPTCVFRVGLRKDFKAAGPLMRFQMPEKFPAPEEISGKSKSQQFKQVV